MSTDDAMQRIVLSITEDATRASADRLRAIIGPPNPVALKILEQNRKVIASWASAVVAPKIALGFDWEAARAQIVGPPIDFERLGFGITPAQKSTALDFLKATDPAGTARAVQQLQTVLTRHLDEARADATDPGDVATIDAAAEMVNSIDWSTVLTPAQLRDTLAALIAMIGFMVAVVGASDRSFQMVGEGLIAFLAGARDLLREE